MGSFISPPRSANAQPPLSYKSLERPHRRVVEIERQSCEYGKCCRESGAAAAMNCQGQAQVRGRRRATRTPLPAALGVRRDRERERREERYAASKWGAAPAAAALPPPPTHWRRDGRCRPEPDRALPLKLLLNVSAS
ncbi:unnamed protein product, partial [Iphiclides podalirius]